MQFILVPLVPLALSLGCIHAHHSSDNRNLHPTPDHPLSLRTSDISSNHPDLVAHAEAQKAPRDSMPLLTPEFELGLLSDAVAEVQYLDNYDDNQRERLSAMLKATRAIIKRHSALPTIIDPDTDLTTLKRLAAQFEITFLEHASLSSSPLWAKYCMAALLDNDTLIRLLPSLSEGFLATYTELMLQAAAAVEDFDTIHAIAFHSQLDSDKLREYIEDDALFSGSVELMRRIVDFVPSSILHAKRWLKKTITLNHYSLSVYLYSKTIWEAFQNGGEYEIGCIFGAIASRGWKALFEQLYRDHPHCLITERCLEEAAKHGRINILEYLLFHEVLGSQAKASCRRAFKKAVGSGNIEAIKVLLEYDQRESPNSSMLSFTKPSRNILEAASKSGRWDGIEYLMEQKNKGDARFADFKLAGDAEWAMYDACRGGNLNVLRQLLQRDSRGHFVFTFNAHEVLSDSLTCACDHGHLPIVQELLKYSDVDPAYRDNKALFVACTNGHLLVVRELLRDGRVNAGARRNEPLIAACSGGYLLVVRELLQQDNNENYLYNVDPAARNNEALIAACKEGHLLVVRELLQHKSVDPSARDGEPLISACRKGHLLVVRELLQKRDGRYTYNVEPDVRDNEALIAACDFGHLLVVRELLQHERVEPSARYNQPLISACGKGHLLVVEELLQKDDSGNYIYPGIDPAAGNHQCLIEASQYGHLNVVEFLLQKRLNAHGVMEYEHAGIDPAAREHLALLEARGYRRIAIVTFLTKHIQ